jgi:hypothetical protein
VASTPVDVSEVPALIGVLADALGDAIGGKKNESVAAPRMDSVLSLVRRWLRPRLAQITELRLVRDSSGVHRES